MKTRLLATMALLLAAPLAAQEIVTLPVRGGATQSYLLLAPNAPPQAVALLFPGGPGLLRLRAASGQPQFSPNNFLVRSREYFVDGGITVGIVDAPSDHQTEGMPNVFRKSTQHAADVRLLVRDLKSRFPGMPVFLIGTSMGTVSAAYVGRELATEVAGVVLTASVFVSSGRRSKHGDSNLSDFDLASIKTPLLIVHHREDACSITPYGDATRRAGKIPLISVRGGDPPTSEPCESQSRHGFLGKERETVSAIVQWMLKKPHPAEIE